MKLTGKTFILLICCAATVLLSIALLGDDSAVYMKWCLMSLLFGAGFYPLSSKIFSTFKDRGWIFSQAIGIAFSGFLAFALIACGLLKFTTTTVVICTVVLMVICWIFKAFFDKKREASKFENLMAIAEADTDINLIILEEFLLLAVFLMWTYFAGFRAQAYGTEKFMDYGFMAAMMRDDTLPARDLWYSLNDINYYYGGQYYAVFLTKLSGAVIEVTYNLMRAFAAAFAFVLPFSIVYHMVNDRAKSGAVSIVGGLLSGAAVSFAGNMHYVLYGLFGNVFKLSGYEDYWFPSSTRYIGHNPLTDDQCIHEFPSYSFVLGDLHAHVVNVMFVLCFVGILYAWLRKRNIEKVKLVSAQKGRSTEIGQTPKEPDTISGKIKAIVSDPYIWMLGLLLGIFQFTNYWDFVIYFTVGVIGIVLITLRCEKKLMLVSMLFKAVLMTVVALAAAMPFNSTFKKMIHGFALCENHSAFYQMVILWGLPVCAVIMLLIFCIRRSRIAAVKTGEGFVSNITLSDMAALLFGICAIGLILIPELVYARDIYENGYARSNTMFKLTYQAFILFGMAMPYAIVRVLRDAKKLTAKIVAGVLLFLLILTFGYFPYAVNCWYGNVFDTSGYKGLDATAFLEDEFSDDAGAIRWLNENVEGNPVVLEAPGDSYSDYERVSAMTGLPTVVGWYVHEWLWRDDPADLNQKIADVETIYTSGDAAEVSELIKEYDVSYIFIGSCEKEKYGGNLNEDLLQSLGEIVYGTDDFDSAYIIKISAG